MSVTKEFDNNGIIDGLHKKRKETILNQREEWILCPQIRLNLTTLVLETLC